MQQDLHRLEKWTERSIWEFNKGKSKVCTWGRVTPCEISKGKWIDWLESSLEKKTQTCVCGNNNKTKEKEIKTKPEILEDKLPMSQECAPVLSILARVQQWVQWRATKAINGGWSIWCARTSQINLFGLKKGS